MAAICIGMYVVVSESLRMESNALSERFVYGIQKAIFTLCQSLETCLCDQRAHVCAGLLDRVVCMAILKCVAWNTTRSGPLDQVFISKFNSRS